MRKFLISSLPGILFLTLISCGGGEGEESSSDGSVEKIKEDYTFEMKDTLDESIVGFQPTKAGAVYTERSKVLSVYFANFDTPESKHGVCCNSTGSDDKQTVSFVLYLDDDSNIDFEESFLNYSNKNMMSSLNMVNYDMTGKVDLKENSVEGELQYTHKENPDVYAKTTFKLNLERE